LKECLDILERRVQPGHIPSNAASHQERTLNTPGTQPSQEYTKTYIKQHMYSNLANKVIERTIKLLSSNS
jgi:hypothetical protein